MEEEERKFIKKINVDKARNKAKVALVFIIISILTYIEPLIAGEFDFGLIFEIASLIFLIIAMSYMNKYEEDRAKRYTICAMAAIGWIIIYDLIIFISCISNIMNLFFIVGDYLLSELLSIIYIIFLYGIILDVNKINNPEKYKESTDWFYEKYEKDGEK